MAGTGQTDLVRVDPVLGSEHMDSSLDVGGQQIEMAVIASAAVSLGLPNSALVVGQHRESGSHQAGDQLPTPAETFRFTGAVYPHDAGIGTGAGRQVDGACEPSALTREDDVPLPVRGFGALLAQRCCRIGALGRLRVCRGQPDIVADRDGCASQDCNQQQSQAQPHRPAAHRRPLPQMLSVSRPSLARSNTPWSGGTPLQRVFHRMKGCSMLMRPWRRPSGPGLG